MLYLKYPRVAISQQISEWKTLYDSASPHRKALPDPWSDDLNRFQQLIVLRCLRPDKVGNTER